MGKKSRRRAAGGATGNGINKGSGGGGSRGLRAGNSGGDRPTLAPTTANSTALVSFADLPVERKLEVPRLLECWDASSKSFKCPEISLTGIECTNEDPSRCAHCSVKFETGYEALREETGVHIRCGGKICWGCTNHHISVCDAPNGLFHLRLKAGVPWAQFGRFELLPSNVRDNLPPSLLTLLKSAADGGHPHACFIVAKACWMGGNEDRRYCQRDFALAREYAERAIVLDPPNFYKLGRCTLSNLVSEYIARDDESEAMSIMSLFDPALYYVVEANKLLGAGGISANPIREANLRRRALLETVEASPYKTQAYEVASSKATNASDQRLTLLQGPSRTSICLHNDDSSPSLDSSYLTSVGGNFCDCCGKTPSEAGVIVLRKCSRCRLAFYCSQDCQTSAWQTGHENWCFEHGRIKPDAMYVIKGLTEYAMHLNGEVVKVVGKASYGWQVDVDGQIHVVTSKNLRHARPRY